MHRAKPQTDAHEFRHWGRALLNRPVLRLTGLNQYPENRPMALHLWMVNETLRSTWKPFWTYIAVNLKDVFYTPF